MPIRNPFHERDEDIPNDDVASDTRGDVSIFMQQLKYKKQAHDGP